MDKLPEGAQPVTDPRRLRYTVEIEVDESMHGTRSKDFIAVALREHADALVSERRMIGARLYEQPSILHLDGKRVGRA